MKSWKDQLRWLDSWSERSIVGRYFDFKRRHTSLVKETTAGLVTFLTVAYILPVNAAIISASGGACRQSTCLGTECAGNVEYQDNLLCLVNFQHGLVASIAATAAICSALVGLFANLPIAVAPGMGLSVYLAYSVIGVDGSGPITYDEACTCILIEGVLFLLIGICRLRMVVLALIPPCITLATCGGLGLLLATVGYQSASGLGLLVRGGSSPMALGGCKLVDQSYLYSLGAQPFVTASSVLTINGTTVVQAAPFYICSYGLLTDPKMWLGLIAGLIMTVMMMRGWRGALVIGILLVSAISWLPGSTVSYLGADSTIPGGDQRLDLFRNVVGLPDFSMTAMQLGWTGFEKPQFYLSIAIFLYLNLLDASGTHLGIAAFLDRQTPGLVDPFTGALPRLTVAQIIDAVSGVVSALLGVSPAIVLVESTTGIRAGGRTGLSALVVAVLFGLTLFFTPLIASIPPFATGAALILVGTMMMENLRDVPWDEPRQAIPAFMTLALIPLTQQVSIGVLAGAVAYVALYLLAFLYDVVTAPIRREPIALVVHDALPGFLVARNPSVIAERGSKGSLFADYSVAPLINGSVHMNRYAQHNLYRGSPSQDESRRGGPFINGSVHMNRYGQSQHNLYRGSPSQSATPDRTVTAAVTGMSGSLAMTQMGSGTRYGGSTHMGLGRGIPAPPMLPLSHSLASSGANMSTGRVHTPGGRSSGVISGGDPSSKSLALRRQGNVSTWNEIQENEASPSQHGTSPHLYNIHAYMHQMGMQLQPIPSLIASNAEDAQDEWRAGMREGDGSPRPTGFSAGLSPPMSQRHTDEDGGRGFIGLMGSSWARRGFWGGEEPRTKHSAGEWVAPQNLDGDRSVPRSPRTFRDLGGASMRLRKKERNPSRVGSPVWLQLAERQLKEAGSSGTDNTGDQSSARADFEGRFDRSAPGRIVYGRHGSESQDQTRDARTMSQNVLLAGQPISDMPMTAPPGSNGTFSVPSGHEIGGRDISIDFQQHVSQQWKRAGESPWQYEGEQEGRMGGDFSRQGVADAQGGGFSNVWQTDSGRWLQARESSAERAFLRAPEEGRVHGGIPRIEAVELAPPPFRLSIGASPYSPTGTQPSFSVAATQQPFTITGTQQPFGTAASQQLFAMSGSQPSFSMSGNQQPFTMAGSRQPFSVSGNQPPFSMSGSQQPVGATMGQQPIFMSASQQPFSIGMSHLPFSMSGGQQPFAMPGMQQPFTIGVEKPAFAAATFQGQFSQAADRQSTAGDRHSFSLEQPFASAAAQTSFSTGSAQQSFPLIATQQSTSTADSQKSFSLTGAQQPLSQAFPLAIPVTHSQMSSAHDIGAQGESGSLGATRSTVSSKDRPMRMSETPLGLSSHRSTSMGRSSLEFPLSASLANLANTQHDDGADEMELSFDTLWGEAGVTTHPVRQPMGETIEEENEEDLVEAEVSDSGTRRGLAIPSARHLYLQEEQVDRRRECLETEVPQSWNVCHSEPGLWLDNMGAAGLNMDADVLGDGPQGMRTSRSGN